MLCNVHKLNSLYLLHLPRKITAFGGCAVVLGTLCCGDTPVSYHYVKCTANDGAAFENEYGFVF
jgi:hypothetical protein